jgi:hypothetical protein
MTEQDALGLPGGSAGIDEIDAVLGLRPGWGRGIRGGGQHRFVALGPVRGRSDDDEALDAGSLAAERFRLRAELGLEEQHGRRGVGDDLRQLLRRQAPVQRDRDETCELGGAHRLEILQTVLRQHGKARLALQAIGRERVGEPAGAGGECGEGDAPLLEHHGGLARKIARVALDDVTEHAGWMVHSLIRP